MKHNNLRFESFTTETNSVQSILHVPTGIKVEGMTSGSQWLLRVRLTAELRKLVDAAKKNGVA